MFFYLLTRGRTGSTAVIDEIDKSGTLLATQELFSLRTNWKMKDRFYVTFKYILPYDLWKKGTVLRGILLKLSFDGMFASLYLSKAESFTKDKTLLGFSFKVLSHHFVERPFLLKLLRKRNYKAIYLKRNIARQVMSGMIANQRGIYNSLEDVVDTQRYSIDLNEFSELVLWEKQCVENDCELLKQKGFDFIVVSYEEFCDDKQSFFNKVFNFLQIPPPSCLKRVTIL